MIILNLFIQKNGENENTEEASETSSIQPIEEEEDESELDEEEQENEEQSEAPEKQEDLNIPGALKEEKEVIYLKKIKIKCSKNIKYKLLML